MSVVRGDRGQPGAGEVHREAAGELGRHVLAIGRAAAVAAEQQLAALAEGLGDLIGRGGDSGGTFDRHLTLDGGTFQQVRLDL